LTWVRGRHTFKFGAEYRNFAYPERVERNGSGTFFFSNASTGLTGINSGNSFASFLLEKVYTANVDFRALPKWSPEAISFNAHFGDTWKATPNLSINYGIRWDFNPPSVEDRDQFSFFDPLGTNPGAGGRRGRLAFAGDKWGEASFGRRHPEEKYYKAFAPRLGIAYSLTPKTVIRAGYGIFFTQMYYPGWEGGISTDGFNANVAFSSQLGGLQPAFVLSGGFPQNFQRPPFIDSTFLNGKSTAGANNGFGNYRPFDANRLPYAQQWNLTVEHQFTNDFYVSTAYVGNKGTRLPSTLAPLNALDPRLLSTGQQLFDQFQPGQTELNGVPIPYAGWVEQMQACPPTMAQAMLPYPQYCGNIYGLNENAGNSTYHSFQLKAEKRFSGGIWVLTSYTISKILSSADNMNPGALLWSGLYGTISPFDRKRNKSLGLDDVPQILSAALIYQLPFGSGKRFASKAGVVDKLVGGWQISSIFRASGGTPFFFRSSNCNVPGQFAAGCIPAISPGANPFAQDKGNFEPTKPLFNRAAFENSDSAGFQFALGHGPRMSNVRGFGFHDHSLGLVKNTRIKEGLNFQIRAEFFNLWSWHVFAGNAGYGNNDFNTDIASPTFGMWNGVASPPRNIQVGARIEF